MKPTSKLCDGADWFRPEMQEIIENELREVPRFHRKQWESAMIFHSLRESGKLNPDKLGLSMGGGKELIAYAIAPHVKQLVITDLYEMNTSWDCAKTDDPDEYIRQNKPFPVDDAKMKAVRMDMRALKFADKTFDFCYSTCAVEHIGTREDFLLHFNEVARVLKDDGLYVFTTEVLYGDETIRDENNYVFSLSDLRDVLGDSNLMMEEVFDARIAEHKVNHPLPSTLKQLAHFVPESLAQRLIQEAPHIQLLRGKHPFTCGIFVLRRKERWKSSQETRFVGLAETKRFVEAGVEEYRATLDNSRVTINPYSLLPGELSRFCADHVEFFKKQTSQRGDTETPFHTDYFWWGNGKRVFDIALRLVRKSEGRRLDSSRLLTEDSFGEARSREGEPEIEFRVHRYKTLDSRHVECVATVSRPVQHIGWMAKTFELDMDDEYCYAILAKVRNGSCVFDKIEVKSYPARLSPVRMRENAETVKHELIAAYV